MSMHQPMPDFQSLSSSQQVELEARAHRILSDRSRAGVIAYPMVCIFLGFLLGIEHLNVVYFFGCGGIFILALWRSYLVFGFDRIYRRSSRRWYRAFAANLVMTAVFWSVFVGWTLGTFGMGSASILVLMMSAIIAFVAVIIFAPDLMISWSFVTGMVLPVVGVLISLQERVAWTIAGATLVFLLYGYLLGRQLHGEFWRSIISQRLLKEGQRELREAKEELQEARDELRQRVLDTEASLREREADYQRVFEGAHDAILVVDPESLRILEVNPWASNTYGYDRSELVGLSLEAITENLTKTRANFERALQREGLHRFEAVQWHRDGHRLLLEINTSVVEYQGRQALLCIHRDLTAQRRSEELRLAKEAAEHGNVAKGQFLANMSHEIRTPMGGILGVTALLRKADLQETERGYVDLIEETAEGLLSLIDDILDFSKIEAGKLAFEQTPFAVHHMLQQVIALMRTPAQEKGLSLSLFVDDNVPSSLVGDSRRIRQVVLNLLGNAIKFTEEGRVALAVECLGDGPKRIRCSVTDTGIGIAPEVQARLFDTFTQADETMARRFGGAGLGLAISKRLVELMGGSLGFDSELGLGSTFWFEIPAVSAVEEVAGEEPRAQDSAPIQRQDFRILLAEDNEVNRLVAMAQLASLGYRADAVNDGHQALRMLQEEAFDLVLMDCQMPGLDGYDTTRRMRQHPELREIPVIALTAHAMTGDREKCLEAGMNDYISKPFKEEALAELLDRWMATTSAAQGTGASPSGDASS